MKCLKLYQHNYPQPAAEIEQYLKETEIEFLFEDIPSLFQSMQVGTDTPFPVEYFLWRRLGWTEWNPTQCWVSFLNPTYNFWVILERDGSRIREIVLSLRNFSRLDEAEVKEVDIYKFTIFIE